MLASVGGPTYTKGISAMHFTPLTMSLIYRTRRVLTRYGFGGLLMKARIVLFDHWFDFRYGVDTCRRESLDKLRIDSCNRSHGNRYEPSRILPVRRFLAKILPSLPEPRVLVDMGSGKGRVLLVASQFGFSKVKGVEFARELCDTALYNCVTFKHATGAVADFEVVQGDAASYAIAPDDNTFFFFNPFTDVVMAQVLHNIEESWRRFPRRILICCYNLPSSELLDRLRYFSRQAEHDFWGYKFLVYESASEAHNRTAAHSAAAEQQQTVNMIHPH